jgi:hypothetical protein
MPSLLAALALATLPLTPSNNALGAVNLVPTHTLLGQTGSPKSVSLFLVSGELLVGAVGGYLALVGGIAVNLPRGGVSLPPDTADILLIGALPAAVAAGAAWLVGLIDLRQRSLIGSLLSALVGGAVGEAAGLGLGYLYGSGLYPNDAAAAVLVAMFIAPALAAIGATAAMELFKPGEQLSPTVSLSRDRQGHLAAGPAIAVRF